MRFTRGPLESDLQSQIIQYAYTRGWFGGKIEFKSFRGGPDTVFIRNRETIWIEVKKKDESARIQQLKRKDEMEAHGAECYVVDNLEMAKEILK